MNETESTTKEVQPNTTSDPKRVSGIYKIINKINGKYYVGSTNNFNKRWYNHKRDLKKSIHKTKHLQSAWNKYGEENFIFQIIETTEIVDLLAVEQKYLNIAKKEQSICYNTIFNAERPNLGRKESDEQKKEKSERMKAFYKNGGVNARKGKVMSDEQRKKISETKLLRKFKPSLEQRELQSKMVSGKNNYFYGKSLGGSLNGRYIATILDFYNIFTNEFFSGPRHDLIKKFNLLSGNVCNMIQGKVKHVKGWTLLKNTNSLCP